MILIVVKHPVRPEFADDWASLVQEFTAATRAEPGNLFFDWFRGVEDPNLYVLVEAFRDAAAGHTHVNSAHFHAAMTRLPTWLSAVPDIVNVEVPGEDWSRMSEMQIDEDGAPSDWVRAWGDPMDPDQLKAMYRRWLLEEWSQGNYVAADELIAEDLIDHNPLPGQPAGRAGEIWTAKMVRKAFPDAHFDADVVVSDGEYVIGRWTMTGTNTGPFDLFDLPPTGRPVTMIGQEIFRVQDGKFAEVWHQEDVGGMLNALGLEPPALMMRLAARRSARRYRRQRHH